MKIGVGGEVTFKNGKLDRFLNKICLENIVLEIDAPYLALTPLSGKRKESSSILNVVTKLADICGFSQDKI